MATPLSGLLKSGDTMNSDDELSSFGPVSFTQGPVSTNYSVCTDMHPTHYKGTRQDYSLMY